MSVWSRWLQHPQRVWLRRAMFQIHLWTGLALGLYVVVLSVTGSALVYRRELVAWLRTPPIPTDPSVRKLSVEELRAAAERAYPGYEVAEVTESRTRETAAARIALVRPDEKRDRLFNPYTGVDLGDAFTRGERAVIWTVRLHDDLLFDSDGRFWNGVGSACVTVLCLTGAIVWWPGIGRWRRSLTVSPRAGWRRVTWDLHSALGAWLFLFMLMWGLSGFYMGVPAPFTAIVEWVSDQNPDRFGERPGDLALQWLSRLHFGRWRSAWLKAVWAVVGLVPAVMFATGAVMWWNRVVRKRASRNADNARRATARSV